MIMIDSGTRADVFRARTEDTNQLKQKGSLYAGTGVKSTVNETDVYKTTEITPPPRGN